jgi:hypothetical protein
VKDEDATASEPNSSLVPTRRVAAFTSESLAGFARKT